MANNYCPSAKVMVFIITSKTFVKFFISFYLFYIHFIEKCNYSCVFMIYFVTLSQKYGLSIQYRMEQRYSSELFERAVDEISRLPGIGRKTALRLVLHMLRMDTTSVDNMAEAITRLRHDVKYCKVCHNISDTEVCRICSDTKRDSSIVCVVENIQDVMAIEATMQFSGLYHVLGGVISPIDGVGPGDLQIQSLIDRVAGGGISEVILALSSTMEGDTTSFYISRKLKDNTDAIKLTVLARGLSVNDELQYTDEATLGRSIVNRVPFNS